MGGWSSKESKKRSWKRASVNLMDSIVVRRYFARRMPGVFMYNLERSRRGMVIVYQSSD